jgi:hypothetical protein
MRSLRHVTIVLFVLASACSYAPPPIRVYGFPTDLERLAGQWAGAYRGEQGHRRSGSIAFTLTARTHEAAGDVLMTPEGASPYERYYGDDESRRGLEARVAPTHLLSIRFADVEGAWVSGRLDNFWDPDRQTNAYSIFAGRLADDVIEGTFTTVYANGDPNSTGRWKVRRVRRAEKD